jgi:8-oxo-dGTP pyrophosphatase MutT (NUDIX family)
VADLRDAATVLLLRDRDAGGFEVLMVKRHGASGFMAGAHVFPGGKLDAGDSAEAVLARCEGRTAEDAQRALAEPELDARVAQGLFVAAARETFEEAGVLLARQAVAGDLSAARTQLNTSGDLASVLAALDARLQLGQLVPLSRWITPVIEPRRFDTRFFLARAPEGRLAAHDAHETTEHAWLTPVDALDLLERGDILLPPPTLISLQWLSLFASAQTALKHAAQAKPPRVAPIIQEVDGKLTVLLPGDPLHPDPIALEGSTRVVLENGRFWAK